jgi:uncharacterized protein
MTVVARPSPALEPFVHRRTALLTTYRRDGTPVRTPVTMAVAGDRAFVRSYDKAWKAKRMRNNPDVRIVPSTGRGKPRGTEIGARSRLLRGDEASVASRAVAHRQPILQGVAVPLVHRIKGYETLHYELTPGVGGGE